MSISSLLELKGPLALTGIAMLLLTSCGNYQQVSYYDNDGIYGSSNSNMAVQEARPAYSQPQSDNNGFYQEYFGEKAQELDQVLADEVFTDIDAYTSRDSAYVSQDSLLGNPNEYLAFENEYQSYPAWGDRGGNVSINFYGSNFGTGWYDPWLWNNWGYASWYRPWRYSGWNGWGWGMGGFYDPWFGNGWFGYGFTPYYGNYYGYPYRYWGYSNFAYRNFASGYTRGRRGYSNNTQNPRGDRYASNSQSTPYRLNSGRSNATNNARFSSTRSTQARNNLDAGIRNDTYRALRSTRSTYPSSGSSQYYRNSISRTPAQTAPARSYQNRNSGTSTRSGSSGYRTNSNYNRAAGSSYRSSGGNSRPSSGSYRSSGNSSSRSSGGNFSSGSSSRSSSGSSRSSGGSSGRSSGGRSGGGRGN